MNFWNWSVDQIRIFVSLFFIYGAMALYLVWSISRCIFSWNAGRIWFRSGRLLLGLVCIYHTNHPSTADLLSVWSGTTQPRTVCVRSTLCGSGDMINCWSLLVDSTSVSWPNHICNLPLAKRHNARSFWQSRSDLLWSVLAALYISLKSQVTGSISDASNAALLSASTLLINTSKVSVYPANGVRHASNSLVSTGEIPNHSPIWSCDGWVRI